MVAQMSAADASKVLDRLCDLLSQLSVIPFLMHLRFGEVVEKLNKKRSAQGAAEVAFKPKVLPYVVMWLLVLAELMSSTALLDPEDKLVQRAAGQFFRIQEEGNGAFSFSMLIRLMKTDDIYAVFRFIACMTGIGGVLFATWWTSLDAPDGNAGDAGASPKAVIGRLRKALRQVVGSLLSLKLLLVLLISVSFLVGNVRELLKLARQPSSVELLKAIARLVRAIALILAGAGAVQPQAGSLKMWCSTQVALAFLRASRVLVYERVSLQALVDLEDRSPSVSLARGAVAMELICGLAAARHIIFHRRSLLAAVLLGFPGILLCQGRPAQASAHIAKIFNILADEDRPNKLAYGVVGFSAVTLFSGGFPVVVVMFGVLQALMRMHSIDKLKY